MKLFGIFTDTSRYRKQHVYILVFISFLLEINGIFTCKIWNYSFLNIKFETESLLDTSIQLVLNRKNERETNE